LYELAQQDITVQALLAQANREDGIFREHLSRLLLGLENSPPLMDQFKRALQARQPIQIDSTVSLRLQNQALIRFKDTGFIVFCDLYRNYFLRKFGLSLGLSQ
jgi:AAA-like domain